MSDEPTRRARQQPKDQHCTDDVAAAESAANVADAADAAPMRLMTMMAAAVAQSAQTSVAGRKRDRSDMKSVESGNFNCPYNLHKKNGVISRKCGVSIDFID